MPKHKNGKTGREVEAGVCPVCGSADRWTFTEIRGVPIHCNVLSPSKAHALGVQRGDLEMSCCNECAHVYNAAFQSEEMKYDDVYENSLFFSEKYRSYAASLAERLVERFDLRGKKIIEIGCGAGDFLKLLCDKGENEGIGFDPSTAAGSSIAGHPRITLVRDYYSSKYRHLEADFISCRHVLEHLESPSVFLNEIVKAMPPGKRTALFFEVPDVMFILKGHSSWDLIYEHPSSFSMSSLRRLFSMAGCRVEDLWRSFHNQFLCVCVSAGMCDDSFEENESDRDKKDVAHYAGLFSKVLQDQVGFWTRRLHLWRQRNDRVVLWGAGSKGITFLNILQASASIDYVVDVNSRKQGKFVPGTGQTIVSPDFLKQYLPDAVILMNRAYETEILDDLRGMGLSPEVLTV
jgi:SAM-dependent methyltransferase